MKYKEITVRCESCNKPIYNNAITPIRFMGKNICFACYESKLSAQAADYGIERGYEL